MASILKLDLTQKINNIRQNVIPYLMEGIKVFFLGKKIITIFYLLDLKNKWTRLPSDVKQNKLAALGNDFEIKILSQNDSTYRGEFIVFAKEVDKLYQDDYIEWMLNNCFIVLAMINKKVVGITCFVPKEYCFYDLPMDLVLGENQVLRFWSVVDEKHRRKGIISLLWDCGLEYALANGYEHVVAAIDHWNKASYIPTLKLGFEKYATTSCSQRFFIQRYNVEKISDNYKEAITLRLNSGKIIKV